MVLFLVLRRVGRDAHAPRRPVLHGEGVDEHDVAVLQVGGGAHVDRAHESLAAVAVPDLHVAEVTHAALPDHVAVETDRGPAEAAMQAPYLDRATRHGDRDHPRREVVGVGERLARLRPAAGYQHAALRARGRVHAGRIGRAGLVATAADDPVVRDAPPGAVDALEGSGGVAPVRAAVAVADAGAPILILPVAEISLAGAGAGHGLTGVAARLAAAGREREENRRKAQGRVLGHCPPRCVERTSPRERLHLATFKGCLARFILQFLPSLSVTESRTGYRASLPRNPVYDSFG